MTDDIVTRLREWHTKWDWDLPDEAADEIERLRAEIQRSTAPPRIARAKEYWNTVSQEAYSD